jgi:hypothetical protein
MLSAGMHAVELPPRTVELELGRRWHRKITGPSGLLLVLAMFVAATHADRELPVLFPLAWPPYVYGLLFALAAAAHTRRGLVRAFDALRIVNVVLLSLSCLCAFVFAPIGLLFVIPPGLCYAALGWRARSERRAALCAIGVGMLCTLAFGALIDSFAGIGMYLAEAASIGLLVGGLVWMYEASSAAPLVLPAAIVRR